MKKALKNTMVLLLVLLLTVGTAACVSGGGSQTPSGSAAGESAKSGVTQPDAADTEPVTLELWHSAFVGPDELAIPESEWAIAKIISNYKEQNPHITVNLNYQADQMLMQNNLKASVLAGTAPDLVNIFSGYLVTSMKEILLDITSMIPQDDKTCITGWDAVSEGLSLGALVLGYPLSGAGLGMLLYNKELVSAAGVDFDGDAAPKNAGEFIEALRKIKASGVLPIIGSESGYNSAFTISFGNWWTQQVGSGRVISNSLGTTKFAEDEAFLASLQTVADIYAEGLINVDYATTPDPYGPFYNGEAAMMITGNWDLQQAIDMMGDNVSFVVPPSFKQGVQYENAGIGGVGQALCVVNTTKHAEESVALMSFLFNRENVITFTALRSDIPQRTDVSAADVGWQGKPAFEKLIAFSAANRIFPWNDNSMHPDVMQEYYKQSALAVIGTITAEECARLLDERAAEVNRQ